MFKARASEIVYPEENLINEIVWSNNFKYLEK